MSHTSERDPVALIRGHTLAPEAFRCPECRAVGRYSVALPVGGTTCNRCNAAISTVNILVYASLGSRLLALLVDFIFVGVSIFGLYLANGAIALTYAPQDRNGNITHTGAIWYTASFVIVSTVFFVGYLLVANGRGRSIGKHATGLKVVRADSGEVPGVRGAVLRTGGQLLTIATAGIGYAMIGVDPQRRALHDRVARTIVIE